mmetsp:Transcript_36772/g.41920  ORF Transcript_36772/g.41920 Transcript_36772/m.41920 type:complete len:146 (-) Transcript_36772:58-495(-)
MKIVMLADSFPDPLGSIIQVERIEQKSGISPTPQSGIKRQNKIIQYSLIAFGIGLSIALNIILILYIATDAFEDSINSSSRSITKNSSARTISIQSHLVKGVECCTWGGWDICLGWTKSIHNYCQMNETSCGHCNGFWIKNSITR